MAVLFAGFVLINWSNGRWGICRLYWRRVCQTINIPPSPADVSAGLFLCLALSVGL